jgi:metallo-beta-lactamase superfamily protein
VTAQDLEALGPLDRDLLHLFVAGPGQGEGVAVALPGAGWLLVDGCTTGTRGEGLPLLAIVERWRSSADEPILAMVLTHPHQDHAGGFAELIELLDPRTIALAGTDLLSAARTAFETTKAASDRGRIGAVHAAIVAIDRWEEDHPGKLVALHQGAALPMDGSPASVVTRSPEAQILAQFLAEPGVRKRLKEDANHISVVLEIEHGAARVVLTGDLPRYRTGTRTAVPSGWDQVLPVRPQLGNHVALKVPHHGSADALHPDLMPAAGADTRAWIVTPYNSSRLPRAVDLDGLPQLLDWLPSILLTGVPVSKKVQAAAPTPGTVRIAQLVSRYAGQRVGEPFIDAGGIELTPGDACEPLDPIWAVAVDSAGTLVGRWRGRTALEVVP